MSCLFALAYFATKRFHPSFFSLSKIMADVFEENPCITFGEAAAECGRRWRVLPPEAKEEFKKMAADDKRRYVIELASYKNRGETDYEPAAPPARAKATTSRRKKADSFGKSRPDPKRPKSALV